MKIYKFILNILIVVTIILFGGRVVVLNTISTSGIALDRINDEIVNYKLQNDILSEELLTISSLTSIASEAAKMGFSYKTDKYVLTSPNTLAAKQ